MYLISFIALLIQYIHYTIAVIVLGIFIYVFLKYTSNINKKPINPQFELGSTHPLQEVAEQQHYTDRILNAIYHSREYQEERRHHTDQGRGERY